MGFDEAPQMHAIRISEENGSEPEVFRGNFSFKNSDSTILRFPFPFDSDVYRTSVNIEPHDRTGDTDAFNALFDIDEHYLDEIAERDYVLRKDPTRCQVMPHMARAQWEALELIMGNLAQDFPEQFTFERDGSRRNWANRLLGLQESFDLGRENTLPCPPFEYITRQAQGDFVLLDQRDNNLWFDGGMVTEAFGWSFDFVFGMNWHEWHGPIRLEKENEVIERALQMTLSLPAERHQRRVNWVMAAKPRLDRSLEAQPLWFQEDRSITPETLPDDLFLRVEFQQLYRLPQSHAILFVLRNYLLSFQDLARIRKWRIRLHRVLRDLDPTSERFPGIPARQAAVDWLSRFDDGSPTGQGRGPEQRTLDPAP
jgi:hypothetical protein